MPREVAMKPEDRRLGGCSQAGHLAKIADECAVVQSEQVLAVKLHRMLEGAVQQADIFQVEGVNSGGNHGRREYLAISAESIPAGLARVNDGAKYRFLRSLDSPAAIWSFIQSKWTMTIIFS